MPFNALSFFKIPLLLLHMLIAMTFWRSSIKQSSAILASGKQLSTQVPVTVAVAWLGDVSESPLGGEAASWCNCNCRVGALRGVLVRGHLVNGWEQG